MDNKDIFKSINGLDIKELLNNQPTIHQPRLVNPQSDIENALNQVRKQKEEEQQIQKNIEANTKRIADNTDWICQTVNLLRINNERQTELLQILSDVFALTNSKDEKEAESKLKQILDRIQGFKENYELIMFVKKIGTALITYAFTGEVNFPE